VCAPLLVVYVDTHHLKEGGGVDYLHVFKLHVGILESCSCFLIETLWNCILAHEVVFDSAVDITFKVVCYPTVDYGLLGFIVLRQIMGQAGREIIGRITTGAWHGQQPSLWPVRKTAGVRSEACSNLWA